MWGANITPISCCLPMEHSNKRNTNQLEQHYTWTALTWFPINRHMYHYYCKVSCFNIVTNTMGVSILQYYRIINQQEHDLTDKHINSTWETLHCVIVIKFCKWLGIKDVMEPFREAYCLYRHIQDWWFVGAAMTYIQ